LPLIDYYIMHCIGFTNSYSTVPYNLLHIG